MTNSADDLMVRTVRRNMILALVQRHIFCPVSHEVLDIRTCVVILDSDDDPVGVFSQKGWQTILGLATNNGTPEESVLRAGLRVDPNTVKAGA